MAQGARQGRQGLLARRPREAVPYPFIDHSSNNYSARDESEGTARISQIEAPSTLSGQASASGADSSEASTAVPAEHLSYVTAEAHAHRRHAIGDERQAAEPPVPVAQPTPVSPPCAIVCPADSAAPEAPASKSPTPHAPLPGLLMEATLVYRSKTATPRYVPSAFDPVPTYEDPRSKTPPPRVRDKPPCAAAALPEGAVARRRAPAAARPEAKPSEANAAADECTAATAKSAKPLYATAALADDLARAARSLSTDAPIQGQQSAKARAAADDSAGDECQAAATATATAPKAVNKPTRSWTTASPRKALVWNTYLKKKPQTSSLAQVHEIADMPGSDLPPVSRMADADCNATEGDERTVEAAVAVAVAAAAADDDAEDEAQASDREDAGQPQELLDAPDDVRPSAPGS
eukprot:m51a1_g12448 hypothetical protein (408) ;mRNA; f:163-1510